jgi:hypothetical protein
VHHTVHLDAREGEFVSPDPGDSGGERDAEHAWRVVQSERREVELGDGVNFQDWARDETRPPHVELRLPCPYRSAWWPARRKPRSSRDPGARSSASTRR